MQALNTVSKLDKTLSRSAIGSTGQTGQVNFQSRRQTTEVEHHLVKLFDSNVNTVLLRYRLIPVFQKSPCALHHIGLPLESLSPL